MTCSKLVPQRRTGWTTSLLCLGWIALTVAGCGKDPALQAMETDAHGYLCLQCNGKFYTGAREFLESKCPKCQQNTLADVIGYWCEKDQHLSIRPKVTGPAGAAQCDRCNNQLKNALMSPRKKDLLAWGATRTSPSSR
jgi:hypothetical protein